MCPYVLRWSELIVWISKANLSRPWMMHSPYYNNSKCFYCPCEMLCLDFRVIQETVFSQRWQAISVCKSCQVQGEHVLQPQTNGWSSFFQVNMFFLMNLLHLKFHCIAEAQRCFLVCSHSWAFLFSIGNFKLTPWKTQGERNCMCVFSFYCKLCQHWQKLLLAVEPLDAGWRDLKLVFCFSPSRFNFFFSCGNLNIY